MGAYETLFLFDDSGRRDTSYLILAKFSSICAEEIVYVQDSIMEGIDMLFKIETSRLSVGSFREFDLRFDGYPSIFFCYRC